MKEDKTTIDWRKFVWVECIDSIAIIMIHCRGMDACTRLSNIHVV